MTRKLISGVLGGAALGAAFGFVAGNTLIGIGVCMVAGALAAVVAHQMVRGDSAT